MKVEIFACPGYVHVPRLKNKVLRITGFLCSVFPLEKYLHVPACASLNEDPCQYYVFPFFCCSLFQKLDSLLSCAVAEPQGVVPSVVVGVVGIGHVDGITDNWEKDIDVKELLR